MNFGDLLFALNCDRLKNDIRKIEKIKKRIVQSKNGIYFNYIYIYPCQQMMLSELLIGINGPIYRQIHAGADLNAVLSLWERF